MTLHLLSGQLAADELRRVLRYDPATGDFHWLVTNSQRRQAGMRAGSTNKTLGYVAIGIGGRRYWAHRLAWLYMMGIWPSSRIDHRNGNPSDNRWCNLREASGSQNIANSKCHRDSSSGLKGAHWESWSGKWRSTIRSNGKTHHLGRFKSPDEAHAAYCEAARRLNGEFARMA